MKWPALLTVTLLTSHVHAQDLGDAHKEVCADAYDNSQVLRDDNQLMLARAQLSICQRACPATLARDCQRWQTEIEAKLASVELEARDAAGRRVEAQVRIDDRPGEPLPSTPVELEPGEHHFTFERNGVVIERTAALPQGEKRRRIVANFPGGNKPAVVPDDDRLAPADVTAIALVSIGGAALVVAGALTIKGHVDRGALFDCRPNCPEEDVDSVRTMWTASGIVAGIGGAMVATALVVWLVAGGDDKEVATLRF